MSRKLVGLTTACAVLLFGGCTSNRNDTTDKTSSAASPNARASTASSSIDPCEVVTSQEASSLTGVTYQAGQNEAISDCVYGIDTLDVFTVVVGVASSAGEANGKWAEYEANAQSVLQTSGQLPRGVTMNFTLNDITLSGADRAAVGTATATYKDQTLNVRAIDTLKGTVFFAMSDLAVTHAAPSAAALEAQARTSLGRLP